jgi:hypothetical protein
MEQLSHGAREIQNNKIQKLKKRIRKKKKNTMQPFFFIIMRLYRFAYHVDYSSNLFGEKRRLCNGCGGIRAYIRVNNNFMFVDS